MIFSHWPTGDYPILVNPDVWEYEKISSQRWDSLRVIISDKNIGIASGYGNTHQSVINGMQKVLGYRVFGEDYILYKEGSIVYSNGELYGEKYRTPLRKLWEMLSKEHEQIIRDIIQDSGYSLS